MTTSVWFWNDINDEFKEYNFSYYLVTTTKIWRWALTFLSLNFLIQSLQNFSCFSFINSLSAKYGLSPLQISIILLKVYLIFYSELTLRNQ